MVIDYEMLCDSLDISLDSLMRVATLMREHIKLLKKYGKTLDAKKNIAI